MTSATQTKRLRQRFELWDTDHDGTVKRSDYEAEAIRTVKAFGGSPDSPVGRQVIASYLGIWDYLAPKAGSGVNGAMSADEFVSVVEFEVLSAGGAGFNKVLRATIEAIVELCDTDGDHLVSPKEFRKWGKAIGLSQEDADLAFEKIDSDHDGYLDADELINTVRDYHLGTSDVPLLGL
ncbi:MAG TPA: EF-hand domain-containing protein [Pseudonocardiaceae bacterium]|nr:EF-hand domain-containing protein [Pseudonocardiaceae bacterium]